MSKKQLLAAILKLPTDEQIALIDEVGQHLPADYVAHDESPAFIAELDRRYQAWLKDRSRGIPWEQVQKEIQTMIQKIRRDRGKLNSMPSPKRNLRRRSSNTN
jgi:putative addiction module component (TIGR02574 family)